MKNIFTMFSVGVIALTAANLSSAEVEAPELYKTHCQQCHGASREGGAGPSLVDREWILAQPTAASIGQVIRDGSSNKAMPAWASVLTSAQIDTLARWFVPGGSIVSPKPSIDTDPQLIKVRLPKDFVISVYADNLINPRSIAVDVDDTIYVGSRKAGKLVALQDRNMDGNAETVINLAVDLKEPSGVALHQGDLYVAETSRILKFKQVRTHFEQSQSYEVVKGDLPDKGWHGPRAIEIGPDNKIYIPIGAPCNVCDVESGVFGKIWRMNLDGSEFEAMAKGVRNSVGLAWHPLTQELWFTDNGRDELGDNSPSCELNFAPKKDMHFGFPYCHGGSVLDPDWGADKSCAQYTTPAALLGPHVAPLGLSFYTADQFPEIYKNQLFVAEHGSWNRTQKIGYRINLITLNGNALVSDTVFADFLDGDTPVARPVDIAWLKDGSMLVSDDENGRIYRIRYIGEKPSLLQKAYQKVKSVL